MFFSILLLIIFIFLSLRISPRERHVTSPVHGAGQVGLLAAIALFGVDYFTSFFYATGEMMHALHPYGLDKYAFASVAIIGIANLVFGGLYIYSLGIFNEGGGAFTAAMRYLGPFLSLVVAVILLQDYIFTIVVSSLSGVDQLLSLKQAGGIAWYWHFLIGAALLTTTWYITIRGRSESAQIVFTGLSIFALMTVTLIIGLLIAKASNVPPLPLEPASEVKSIWEILFHILASSMKGLVALTGLEAMSNGIQFVIDEDAAFVKWGRKYLPKLENLWHFYSGKPGIGRTVQTSFLFYGVTTTFMLTYFSIRFNAYDNVAGRSLVGNLAYIGFRALSENGGLVLFWAYQILAVGLLTAASMTAFQDLQAITWRNVAIGEIPEIVVYRNPKGTFTRPVTAAAILAIAIQFLVRGNTSTAVPYYGVGVFMPIAIMGLAMREHIKQHSTGRTRLFGMIATSFASILAALIFIGQIATKWNEGGWVVLIVFILLVIMANLLLISPAGYRDPDTIRRIIREKSRIVGSMGNIVEWQSLRMQEYRYVSMKAIVSFFGVFGVFKPLRFENMQIPPDAGDFDVALGYGEKLTFIDQYLANSHEKELKSDLPSQESITDETKNS